MIVVLCITYFPMDISPAIRHLFAELSLSDKDAQVYISALKSGACSVNQLSGDTKIPRGTIYQRIEALKRIGLITETAEGKKRLFVAESPQNFQAIVDRKKDQLRAKQEKWNQIGEKFPNAFDDLPQDQDALQKPKVQYFNCIDGIIQSYYHILNHAGSELCAYFSVAETEQPNLHKFFIETFSPERARRKIFSKNITPQTPDTLWYNDQSKDLLTEMRFVPPESFPLLNSEINIYKDYVHWMAFDERGGFATITQSPSMAAFERAKFNLLWHSLE